MSSRTSPAPCWVGMSQLRHPRPPPGGNIGVLAPCHPRQVRMLPPHPTVGGNVGVPAPSLLCEWECLSSNSLPHAGYKTVITPHHASSLAPGQVGAVGFQPLDPTPVGMLGLWYHHPNLSGNVGVPASSHHIRWQSLRGGRAWPLSNSHLHSGCNVGVPSPSSLRWVGSLLVSALLPHTSWKCWGSISLPPCWAGRLWVLHPHHAHPSTGAAQGECGRV